MSIFTFVIGAMLGATVGVLTMAILQAGSDDQ